MPPQRPRKRTGGNIWGQILATQVNEPLETSMRQVAQFYCETCDKDLKTEEEKEKHFAEHIQCAEPGCKFNAHFLVVEKHIRMCHGNGYGAINLETEEDIRKWREERRKNFPTKARIAEKNALAEGSAKRGEQIKTKKFDMKEKRAERKASQKLNKRKAEEACSVNPTKFQKMAKPQKSVGLVSYPDSGSDQSSSESEQEESEEEEEEETPPNEFLNSTVAKISQNIKAQPDYETLYNNKLLRSHLTNIQKNGKKVRYPVNSYKDQRTGNREMPALHRPALLEMLLKDEIRQERNRILQAVHYIVQNNFFDSD